jgi:O-antigen/teichoic acid export membrane protein
MDSLKKRYAMKFSKSVTDALINVSLLFFLPRVLGPSDFGSFNYIRESFNQIISLLDMSLSSAHSNKVARIEDSSLVSNVYFSYIFFVGFAAFLLLSFFLITDIHVYIFPEQRPAHLYYGLTLCYLMYIYNAYLGLSDSKGLTFGFDLQSIIVTLVVFIIIYSFYKFSLLNLNTYFFLRILLYFLLSFFSFIFIYKKIGFLPKWVNPRELKVKIISREFYDFSYPLITISIIGLFAALFDRWFLQFIYGSTSQGYYSLAFILTSICTLFLTPLSPLLMQSLAKADQNNDKERIVYLFKKVKILYTSSVFLSFYFMFHTEDILIIVGSEEYNSAKITMLIMFLYPIHTVYGQFAGSNLLALRKTKIYRNVTICTIIFGFISSYLLLAPNTFLIPGFQLDSVGLAIKVVLAQIFSVNLMLFFTCRIIGENIFEYLWSQIIIPIPILFIGLSEYIIRNIFFINNKDIIPTIAYLLITFFSWLFLLAFVIYIIPSLFGTNRENVKNTFVKGIHKIQIFK